MNQQAQVQQDYDEINLFELISILKNSWKLVSSIFLVIVLLVGVITCFLLPKKYRSQALFFLQAEGEYGATFGKVNMVKGIIQTNYFLGEILEKDGLDTSQEVIEKLRNAITVTQTEAGNIKLEIIWGDPQKAYELLYSVYNSYKDEVANRLRIYTTNKMEVAEKQFATSQKVFDEINAELVAFQKKTGLIFLPNQLAISDMYYQDLKRKLGVSPEHLLEYETLRTKQEVAEEEYKKACAILEDTRRLVEKEQKYLFVLIEPPFYPERIYSPSTVKNITVGSVFAIFVGVMAAFLREYIRKYKELGQVVN